MSKDNKNKYEGETFQRVIKETMVANSVPNMMSKLIEDFDEKHRQQTLDKVKGLSSVVDRLKYLLEKVKEETVDDKEDE